MIITPVFFLTIALSSITRNHLPVQNNSVPFTIPSSFNFSYLLPLLKIIGLSSNIKQNSFLISGIAGENRKLNSLKDGRTRMAKLIKWPHWSMKTGKAYWQV